MFSMRLSSVISTIVTKWLAPHDGAVKYDFDTHSAISAGLLFEIDCRMSHRQGDDDEFSSSRFVWILVAVPHSVWVLTTNPHYENERVGQHNINQFLDQFENTSNHDSCWRTDGIDSPLSNVYFEMAEELNKQMSNAGFDVVAPARLHKYVNFGLCGSGIHDVKVTHASIPEDSIRYKRVIQKLVIEN